MNNPTITASGVIPALSCVKVSTTANTVVVCTTSTDTVFGVTFGADTANGGEVVFQTSDTQLDIVTLRAGGTILAGNELVPGAAGVVVTAASGQFIAMTAATSGQTLTAYKKKVGNTAEPGVYGSSRAGQILSDAIAGTDSVDIVVFGDSNAGSPAGAGYGVGWQKAMTSFGAPIYATPLAPCSSDDGSNTRASGLFMPWNSYNWGGRSTEDIGFLYSLTNRIAVAADTDATALNTLFDGYFVRENTARASSATTLQLDTGASSTNGDYVGNYISILAGVIGSNFQTGAGVVNYSTITSYSGTTKTATVLPWSAGTPSATASFTITKFLIRPNSFNHGVAFIPAGSTYTSYAGGPSARLIGGNQLASGTAGAGVALQYRVVYGKFATTGGKFRLRAMKGVNTLVAGSSVDIPTSGGIGYATATLPFTSSTTAGAPDQMKCAWDGYNSGATYVPTGPVAMFYHSIIRTAYKGFCVNTLNYFGGDSTQSLATKLVNMTKHLEAYLKELRERQIESGSSGRVVWWLNSGINGEETGASWTTNAAIFRDAVYNVWVTVLGYPAQDLAFVMSVTHPVVAGDPGAGNWATVRPVTSQTAAAWAQTNVNDGKNVTYVDIESVLTAAQMKSRNLYQVLDNNTLYSAHLRSDGIVFGIPTGDVNLSYSPSTLTGSSDASIPNNGYAVITTGILRKLVASI
jgi:hypothetical protein